MEYISTRGQDGLLSYEQALLSGLARDGGLYLPVSYPRFGEDEISAMVGLSCPMPRLPAASWRALPKERSTRKK